MLFPELQHVQDYNSHEVCSMSRSAVELVVAQVLLDVAQPKCLKLPSLVLDLNSPKEFNSVIKGKGYSTICKWHVLQLSKCRRYPLPSMVNLGA
jgi:hypothetical protein